MQGAVAGLVFLAVLVIFAIIVVAKSVALIPQAEAAVIERLGRYSRTVSGQLTLLVPFIDRVRARVDLRERVVSFPPQPVITEDNLTLNIDTVVYFQVTVPQAAVYEISNYIVGVEQLTTTTLRNVVGGMTLEQTLTSRDQINAQLRGVLDEATGRWGLRVARVELRSIDPPRLAERLGYTLDWRAIRGAEPVATAILRRLVSFSTLGRGGSLWCVTVLCCQRHWRCRPSDTGQCRNPREIRSTR